MSKAVKRLANAFAAFLVIVGVIGMSNVTVFADQYLCNSQNSPSFSVCLEAHYTAHGYDQHYTDNVGGLPGVGYWRTFNGHNCTNYVGYMLTLNGDSGPNVAMGNANQWDDTITNHPGWGYTINGSPAVGSIALWENANNGTGHIAYVEEIKNSGNTLIISEDNAPTFNSFRWRSIDKTGDWPDKFLHIRDVPSAPGTYPGVGPAAFKGSSSLTTGQVLNSNEYITSDNGQSVLIMQTDGNLVLYRGTAAAAWNAGTGGHPGAYLTVQADGNVVVYSAANTPLWWTGTSGITNLTLQADGNLVGYPASGGAQWQSGTGGAPTLTYLNTDHLGPNDQIHPNQYIRSADRRYFLTAQTDGNIVLYGPGYHVLWSTQTGGHPGGAYMVLQPDGNIVVYSATSAPLWWTGTTSTGTLWLQNDGNLVGRDTANTPTWMSGTNGRI